MKQSLILTLQIARCGNKIADADTDRHGPEACTLPFAIVEVVALGALWDDQRVRVEVGMRQACGRKHQLLEQCAERLFRCRLGDHGKKKVVLITIRELRSQA